MSAGLFQSLHYPLWRLIFAKSILLIPNYATHADTGPHQDVDGLTPPILVTATRSPSTLYRSVADADIISATEIEASGANNLVDLFQRIPGIHSDQPGGRSGPQSFYVRGSDPNSTLILVDGVRMNNPTDTRGGTFDLSTINIDQVERIEIIRGAYSPLYGSDALSGVINIITKQPTRSRRDITFRLGSDGYQQVQTAISNSNDKLSYRISASHLNDGMPTPESTVVNKTFDVSLIGKTSAENTLTFIGNLSSSDRSRFPDDSGGPELAARRLTESLREENSRGLLRYQHKFNAKNSLEIEINHQRQLQNIESPGVAPGLRDPLGIPPNIQSNDYSRTQLISLWNHRRTDGNEYLFAIERDEEKADGQATLFLPFAFPTRYRLNRYNNAAFFNATVPLVNENQLQAGIRIDDPGDFASELSSHLGFRVAIGKKTQWRMHWGEGFKLPSFFALGNPIVGNPSLRPESSKTLDFSFEHQLHRSQEQITITMFSNRYYDLIDFDETLARLVNRDEVSTQGLEFAYHFSALSPWSLDFQVSYVKTDIKGTEEELRHRPKWRVSLTANWHVHPRLSTYWQWRYVDPQLDSSIPTGDMILSSYQRLDIGLQWRLKPQHRLELRLENALDAEYSEAIGFPAPERRLFFGYQAKF